MSHEFGRNEKCPCGSGKKYKYCCLGEVDWDSLVNAPLDIVSRYLSIRGKNLLFIAKIMEATGFDFFSKNRDFAKYKKSFTKEAVYDIYSVIPIIWPDLNDYERCIGKEENALISLYVGNYDPEAVFRAISRLSLYCDKIYLVDPFVRATHLREEYSPLVHPENNRVTTIKNAFLWLSLFPWIQAGIVNIIRPIDDFHPEMIHEIINIERSRFEKYSELKIELEKEVANKIKKMSITDRGMQENFFLSMPDDTLLEFYRETAEGSPFCGEQEFMKWIQKKREGHPYFVERMPGQSAEFIQESTGASYELAKRICLKTKAHIVTDMRVRWMEMALDRQEAGIDLQGWSPFAKALQECEMKIINNVPLEYALRLREEQRLESMRLFLRRVWLESKTSEPFSEENAVNLAAELEGEVEEANREWEKIDLELLSWLGAAAGELVVAGVAGFVPTASAAVLTGAIGLLKAKKQRKTFHREFPAGFFLGLR